MTVTESTLADAGMTLPTGLEDIYADIDQMIADLPESALRLNPAIEVGKLNKFEDVYPKWAVSDRATLFEEPDETRPVTSAIDLRSGEIVITRMSYYAQRTQDYIRRGGSLEDATDDDLNTQCEIDIAIPGAKFGFIATDDGVESFNEHPMYTRPQLTRMRSRALVAYVKTRFNADPALIYGLKEALDAAGFEDVVSDRERLGEMKRLMKFNIQAPLRGNPTNVQMRLRQQQDSGFRLKSLTLVAPRPPEQRYRDNTSPDEPARPEFEGFAYHMADNIRWASILTAENVDGLQAFSLTTAITGIDHRSQDDSRPMGNALRATVQGITYVQPLTDAQVRGALDLPAGTPVTAKLRSSALRLIGDDIDQTEINFFNPAPVAA